MLFGEDAMASRRGDKYLTSPRCRQLHHLLSNKLLLLQASSSLTFPKMGFLSELVHEFKGKSGHSSQQQGGPPMAGASQGPPPVSPPWYAEWDGRENRWLFVNQQTGERTFNYPGPGYAQQQGSYGGPQGGYGYGQGGYSNQGAYNQGSYNPTNNYQQQEEQKKQGGNGWKYAAAGVAGVAGGALLMHEGENISMYLHRTSDLPL
jgi:hypothetical protein